MIRDLFGRDLSRDLDRHITGNYGEDQFTRGGKVSKHYNAHHPSVAAVSCPVKGCERGRGVPCVVAYTGRAREGHGTETHIARVRKWEQSERYEDAQEDMRGNEHLEIEDGKMTGEYNG